MMFLRLERGTPFYSSWGERYTIFHWLYKGTLPLSAKSIQSANSPSVVFYRTGKIETKRKIGLFVKIYHGRSLYFIYFAQSALGW